MPFEVFLTPRFRNVAIHNTIHYTRSTTFVTALDIHYALFAPSAASADITERLRSVDDKLLSMQFTLSVHANDAEGCLFRSRRCHGQTRVFDALGTRRVRCVC